MTQAEQFPIIEILDESNRIVRGWATVDAFDTKGEKLPIDEVWKTLPVWMERGGVITKDHTNAVIGRGLNYEKGVHTITNTDGILLTYKVFDNYKWDNDVWNEIKSGERKGLSFGGRVKRELTESTPEGDTLHGIETFEFASVKDPANPYALNTEVNMVAKSNDSPSTEKESSDAPSQSLNDSEVGKKASDLTGGEPMETQNEIKDAIQKSNDAVKKCEELVTKMSEVLNKTSEAVTKIDGSVTKNVELLDQIIAALTQLKAELAPATPPPASTPDEGQMSKSKDEVKKADVPSTPEDGAVTKGAPAMKVQTPRPSNDDGETNKSLDPAHVEDLGLALAHGKITDHDTLRSIKARLR